MGTNWQRYNVTAVDVFELREQPDRNPYWYKSVQPASGSEAVRARNARRLRSTPIANLLSGEYWKRPTARDLSFDRAWMAGKTATAFRDKDLDCPAMALEKSVDELLELGLGPTEITELITSACLPPKRVDIPWMCLGECLYRVLAFDLQRFPYAPATALSINASNRRFLIRNGIVSLARLLFSRPDRLMLLRGFGHVRLSRLVASLLLTDGLALGLGAEVRSRGLPRMAFGEWFHLRANKPTLEVVMAATDALVQDCPNPRAAANVIRSNGLLQLDEAELASLCIGPNGFFRAMSLLSEDA